MTFLPSTIIFVFVDENRDTETNKSWQILPQSTPKKTRSNSDIYGEKLENMEIVFEDNISTAGTFWIATKLLFVAVCLTILHTVEVFLLKLYLDFFNCVLNFSSNSKHKYY